jgi:mannose-6-phosphate isomerase-like protein (cupin superfamily)
MRKTIFAAALLLAASPVCAQTVPQAIVVSAADVAKLAATANAAQTAANPPRANVLAPIIAVAPYALNLEHRIGKQTAAIHTAEAELMIVLGGSASLTTGGMLVGGGAARGGNINGTDITGGNVQHVVQGDMMLVPQGVPHMLAPDPGAPLVLATLHMPRDAEPVPAPGRAAAAPKLYNAAADYPAMIARAKAALPASARFFGGDTILTLAPYRVGLEFRSAKGVTSVHKTDDELMYVLEGEGNIPTGGTVVNPKDTGANIDGDAIQGATDHHMKKGDFIYVPAGVPHYAVTEGNSIFVLATLHVPRPAPAAAAPAAGR